ncbi:MULTISPECIES: L-pipecolate oxidase [Vitreoscilla]|uniref:FAD-binding oxidoreductase n=1 Tax=Vitreoscilla stercoraria TaxID=61 RepID=A0ABY4EA74_VITST|nr:MULTISPECIES: FAD-binding oxidoreductase [Vitreoscilla]AUZ05976.1 FAD-dependent oxidoreductase [Vitreoscilla sp. C1]UOO92651.1 FAD-binding oxidoreductase [Vitreoscilla stercoraria]
MDLKHKCLWPDLVDHIPTYAALKEDVRTDVCVIGAGFTGLNAAIRLRELGKDVRVLEATHLAYGGSGRNVGLVNAGSWIKPDEFEKILGEKAGQKFNKAFGEVPYLVFEMIEKYQLDAQHTHTGTLHMAHNAKGSADIADRYHQWTRRGANMRLLTGAECQEYCGTDKIPSALLDLRCGTVNPFAYAKSLSEAAHKLGAHLHEHTKVVKIERQGSQWLVQTSNGHSVLADKIIIASNAYTEGDWTNITSALYPGYYYQVASKPLTGAAADSILPHKQGSWDTRTVLSSIRRDKDGRLILGSLGRGDNKPEWFLKKWADRVQQFYYPQLGKNVEWEYVWSGRIGFTDDHIPRLFEPELGVVAATGYNGRGVTTGTLMGRLMAEYVIEGNPDILPLPFKGVSECECKNSNLKSLFYETSFSAYHLGQCLNLVN